MAEIGKRGREVEEAESHSVGIDANHSPVNKNGIAQAKDVEGERKKLKMDPSRVWISIFLIFIFIFIFQF